jgi:outer membrane lipoprotein LolB
VPAPPAAEREARLLALDPWEFRGRVAARSAPDRGGQASLDWRQTGDASRIRIRGPFGAGAYQIDWDPLQVTVTTRDGEVALDELGPDAAERFLARELGWSVPVRSARYWVRGLADPAANAAPLLDELGRLAQLTQSGWQIRYEEYALKDSLWLPRRLVMEGGPARVRLVIDTWQF